MLPSDVDILVLGAGTAGSAAANACARVGREVWVLEARALDQAGARWRNGLPASELVAQGLPDRGAQAAHPPGAFHLVAGWGPERVTVREHDLLDVHMPWLVAQLQRQAEEAGATLVGGVKVTGVQDGERAVTVHTTDGSVRARLVVDAAGMTGPTVRERCSPLRICTAAQQDHLLGDPGGAESFLRQHRVEPGETLSFSGVAGGFSIVNCTVLLPRGDHPGGVSVLTGSIPGRGHAAGTVLLQRFLAEQPWIGERVSGGARPIPLDPPDPVVGAGRVVRLGDAARQVYAAHGSGITQGLRAARLLGRVLADGGDAAAFNLSFQRGAGSLAASAGFCAYTASLDGEAVRELVVAGLLRPELIASGLEQQAPDVPFRLLPALTLAALRSPRAAARLLPVLPLLKRLERHQARYPSDPTKVAAWVAKRDGWLARLETSG